jgi:hypothetical protein
MTSLALPFLIGRYDVKYPPPAPAPLAEEYDIGGLLPNGSKQIGLTRDEYEFLLWDIEQAIEEGNRKYGYGGAGYLAADGNYYLPQSTNQFIDHTLEARQNERRRKRKEARK